MKHDLTTGALKPPPQIQHSEPRPENYRAMVKDCAKNIHLRKQSTALLQYYANQANHFRPALATVEKETGIPANKVSEIRQIQVKRGLIAYNNEHGFIYIGWDRIRAFAMLEMPLRLPRGNRYFFSPVRYPRPVKWEQTQGQTGRKYRIRHPRQQSEAEKQWFSTLEAMTAQEYELIANALVELKNGGT